MSDSEVQEIFYTEDDMVEVKEVTKERFMDFITTALCFQMFGEMYEEDAEVLYRQMATPIKHKLVGIVLTSTANKDARIKNKEMVAEAVEGAVDDLIKDQINLFREHLKEIAERRKQQEQDND